MGGDGVEAEKDTSDLSIRLLEQLNKTLALLQADPESRCVEPEEWSLRNEVEQCVLQSIVVICKMNQITALEYCQN